MKYLFTIAAAALLAVGAKAQSVSVRAGANFSNIIKTGDSNFSTDFKPGFHAGLGIDIPIVPALSFAPEILYSQKGYKADYSSVLGGETKYSVTTNFIDVPILAKFKSGGFNLHLGPQVSFLTSTTESWDSGSQQYRETVKEDNSNLKKSIISGVVGLGIDVSPRVSFIGRYALDFQKNNENGTSETPEYKNQVIQVGLGVRL